MPTRNAETPPQTLARVGGALYLIIILVGIFGQAFLRGQFVVRHDAAATAQNIVESEFLWRTGIAAELAMLACAITLAMIFYVLFKPVSRRLALLAVLFNLSSIVLEIGNKLHLFSAVAYLGDAPYLKALEPAQLQSLAYLAILTEQTGFAVSLLFFGFVCLLLGYLIRHSGFMPKAIGALMQVAGACYLTNSFAYFIAPAFEATLLPWILIPAFVGELSLCLWMLVRGVDGPKWQVLHSG